MKLKIRKTYKRKNRNTKRKTNRRYKGGNILVIEYDSVRVAGQEFEKSKTVSAPSVAFSAQPNKLYTLVMWDPDVPPQAQPGFVHWMAINLQSPNDIQNNQLLEYKGPTPPSGTHRYFFGLFEQVNHINPKRPDRPNFDINIFIKENNLRKINEVFMKVSAT